MCWSICPKGFYTHDIAGACQVCPVQLQCTSCVMVSAIVQCTACAYGTFYQTSTPTCTSQCTNYEFKNTWNNSCSTCDVACGNCNGPTNTSCTDCISTNYLLTNYSGGFCLTACPSTGYVPSGGTTCQPCDITCATCNGVSASQCVACANGYYFYSGYCRYICPNGTYPNSTVSQCLSCNPSCSYCFGSTIDNCTSCVTNKYLYNFTCSTNCPNGLLPNQWSVCFESIVKYSIALILMLFMLS